MLRSRLHSQRWLPWLVVATWLAGTAAALAQGEASEKERRKAAKKEQQELRKQQAAEEASQAKATEEAAEKKRVAEMGTTPEQVPLEEEKGFYVQLDAFFVDASGGERTVARVGDISTVAATAEQLDTDGDRLPDAFSITNERDVELAQDSEVTPRVELGWRLGGGASVAVRYWGYSADSSADATVTATFPAGGAATDPLVLGGIDSVGMENGLGSYAGNEAAFARPFGTPALNVDNRLHGADSVVASGKLDAMTFDVTFARTALVKKRIELTWRVGLGYAEAERTEQASFTWRSFSGDAVTSDTTRIEAVEAGCKTTAFGPVVGAQGRFALSSSHRWALRVGLDLGGLKADSELRFRDADVFTQAGLPDPQFRVYQDSTNDGAGDVMLTADADLAIEGTFARRWRLGVGYRYATWTDAIVEEQYPDPANLARLVQDSQDLTFAGPYLRVGVFF